METKLFHGDCLEVMNEIPDGSIDMVLCDMPYGTTRNKWDTIIDLQKMWEHYRRIVKPNGAIVLFSQPPFNAILECSNLKSFRYEWIWKKEAGTGFLNAKKMPLKNSENILVFYEKLPTYNPQMTIGKPYKCKQGGDSDNYGDYERVVTDNSGERYPVNIIEFNREKKVFHPTQKPVPLLEYLIKTYTNEGNTVLDNCMGSGSTGVACVRTNRNFIGIELEEKYMEIATERINQELCNN